MIAAGLQHCRSTSSPHCWAAVVTSSCWCQGVPCRCRCHGRRWLQRWYSMMHPACTSKHAARNRRITWSIRTWCFIWETTSLGQSLPARAVKNYRRTWKPCRSGIFIAFECLFFPYLTVNFCWLAFLPGLSTTCTRLSSRALFFPSRSDCPKRNHLERTVMIRSDLMCWFTKSATCLN